MLQFILKLLDWFIKFKGYRCLTLTGWFVLKSYSRFVQVIDVKKSVGLDSKKSFGKKLFLMIAGVVLRAADSAVSSA